MANKKCFMRCVCIVCALCLLIGSVLTLPNALVKGEEAESGAETVGFIDEAEQDCEAETQPEDEEPCGDGEPHDERSDLTSEVDTEGNCEPAASDGDEDQSNLSGEDESDQNEESSQSDSIINGEEESAENGDTGDEPPSGEASGDEELAENGEAEQDEEIPHEDGEDEGLDGNENAEDEDEFTRASISADLNRFVISANIDAPQDEDGNYIVNPSGVYELSLSFRESESLQFDDEATLKYTFPVGINVADISPNTFAISVSDDLGTATVEGNVFYVSGGALYVRFNQSDPSFERLKASPNVRFGVSVSSRIDEHEEFIVFGPGIVKRFIYKQASDLSITKRVVYDADNDTARYTLKVTSTGVNEDVRIVDKITGTALTLNCDAYAVSSLTGDIASSFDYGSYENGFALNIPRLEDGESVTVNYTAHVNNNKITGKGTVGQTGNEAFVTSRQDPDGKDAKANFSGQVTFHKITKNKLGEAEKQDDGTYKLNWEIRLNEDHKLTVGGVAISDSIDTASRAFMRFSGYGLHVITRHTNGVTESGYIPWSELELLSGENGIYAWSYTPPASDGNASYIITAETEIDISAAFGDLTLTNTAYFEAMKDSDKVTFAYTGANTITAEKKATMNTANESGWEINVNVPAEGLPEFRIVDDLPKLDYGGQTHIDSFIDGSLIVDGLIENETCEFNLNSIGRTFTIKFYRDLSMTQSGLLPTSDGQGRTITVRYKTQVNQDWLALAANDDYNDYHLYMHTNSMTARVGSFRVPDSAYVIPLRPELRKYALGSSTEVIDGVSYPVFGYSLWMLGPTEDGAVLYDKFDTEYLKFHTGGELTITGDGSLGQGQNDLSVTDTEDGIKISVNRFPRKGNGDFCQYYEITYYLIVKDEAALKALNELSSTSGQGVTLKNVATWLSLTSGEVSVLYSRFPYLDKALIVGPSAENGYVAEFAISINAEAEDLDPDNDILAIQDVLSSNLRYLPDTFSISPACGTISVSHDSESNTLTVSGIPDETAFEIRYKARVLGSGSVSYSNTVRLGKYQKSAMGTVVVDSSGSGTASNPSITIVKRDLEDLSLTLAGATFQLFNAENGMTPVTDGNGNNVCFTTGADGRATIVGSLNALGWTLWADRLYCLLEVTSPSGYEISTEPIYFKLTEFPSGQSEYDIVGDTISITNEPIKISLPVAKYWIGPVGAESVTIHLTMDGSDTGEKLILSADNDWFDVFRDLRRYDADGYEINYGVFEDPVENYTPEYGELPDGGFSVKNIIDEEFEIPVKKIWIGEELDEVMITLYADGVPISVLYLHGEDWSDSFVTVKRFDPTDGHEIKYNLEEEPLFGYRQEKIVGDDGSYTFINTDINKTDITVSKRWVGPPADSITVYLTVDGMDLRFAVLSEENGWTYRFEDFPIYDLEDGHKIIYDVREQPLDGYISEKEVFSDNNFVFTNTISGKTSVSVRKAWIGPAADSATVYLYAGDALAGETVLSSDNDWSHTFEDLEKYSSGVEIEYRVVEDDISGYLGSVTAVSGGFEIVNANVKTIDIPVTKLWNGAEGGAVTVRLLADEIEVASAELTDENGRRHIFTDMPLYDITDGHEISYRLIEDPVENCISEISGDKLAGFTVTNTLTLIPSPSPSPEPSGSPSPEPSDSPSPEPSVSPSVEPSASPSPTVSPSHTPKPTPTHTNPPSPTVPPTTPKTGDEGDLSLYLYIALISGVLLICAAVIITFRGGGKKRK